MGIMEATFESQVVLSVVPEFDHSNRVSWSGPSAQFSPCHNGTPPVPKTLPYVPVVRVIIALNTSFYYLTHTNSTISSMRAETVQTSTYSCL